MEGFITVTLPNVPGMKIVKVLGLVQADSYYFKLKSKVLKECLKTVHNRSFSSKARFVLEERAQELGANAIVGYSETCGGGVTVLPIVLATGTAVIIEKETE